YPRDDALAVDDDQHVVFARRKACGHLFVLLELGGFGAKELAQRVIDLNAQHSDRGKGRQKDEYDRARNGKTQRDEPESLDAEREPKRAFLLGYSRAGAVGRA